MGLFDKIKKTAPTVGAAAAAGVYAGQTFAKDKPAEDETPDQKPDGATPFTNANDLTSASTSPVPVNPEAYSPAATAATLPVNLDQPESQTQVDESPESIYDSETGTTTYHHANGITSTEDVNGSHASYNASTGETISQKDGLFTRIKEMNDNIPTEMKAVGLGIPDQPVQELRTYQEGSLEDGQLRYGYDARAGWESTHNARQTSQGEVTPGVGLNSEATYDAQSFFGASSNGEAGAEWNSEEAHLYAHGRTMVGAEAKVDAGYEGTLDVEGINHQPGVEAQGHANAFAGAEAEGGGDLNVSSDGARGSLGGEAFAGAKAEIGGSAAASIDGNEFARGEGGVDARAGIGAELNVDAGYQDGQISYGIDAGAAIGVGAGYHYSGSVDAPGIITHPDAVLGSAVEEVSSYAPDLPSFSTDPSTYTSHAEQYIVQQVQEYVPVPEEVHQVAEFISDPGSVVEDIGSSLGF